MKYKAPIPICALLLAAIFFKAELVNAAGCDVPPIKIITDPDAIEFENGNTINTTKITASTKTGLACMQQKVPAVGGIFNLTSAYRPVSYQDHLRNTWITRDNAAKNELPGGPCYAIYQEADKEVKKHGLITEPAAGNSNAPHPSGKAIDANISRLPAPHSVDTIANACKMYRRIPIEDPVHYEPTNSFFYLPWSML